MGCYKTLEVAMYLQLKARLRVFWSTLTKIKKSVHNADFRLAVTIDCIPSSPLGLTLCRSSKKMVALIILIIALQFDVSTSCNDSLR